MGGEGGGGGGVPPTLQIQDADISSITLISVYYFFISLGAASCAHMQIHLLHVCCLCAYCIIMCKMHFCKYANCIKTTCI